MKKVLAIMLACFMLVSLLPMGALAEEIEQVKCPYEGKNHYKTNCEYTWVADVKGECGEYDYTVYSCNACGDYFAADFVKIDGEHDFVVTKAATCTEAGEQVCAICEAKEEIPALGHKASGEASCLEASVCTVCGEELDAKTAHTWGDKPSKIVKEPDEETLEDGLAEYTCSVCGEVKEVVILAHQCENFTFVYGGHAPSCTEPGMESYFQCNDEKCQRYWTMAIVDGQIIPGEIVDKSELETEPAGHVKGEPTEVTEQLTVEYFWNTDAIAPYVDMTITFSASLPGGGYVMIQEWDSEWEEYYTMDDGYVYDGDTVTFEFKAGVEYRIFSWAYEGGTLEYTYMAGPVTVLGDCTTETVCKYTCAVCGEKVEEKLGVHHDWAVTYHTEPTCDTYGYTIESCLVCGEHSITRHDPFGHSARPADEDLPIEYYPWGDVERENPVKPTCAEDGYYWWNCETCGEEQREVIKALGCDIVTVTVPATCAEYGYSYSFCSRTQDWDTQRSCPTYNWMTMVDSIEVVLEDESVHTIWLDGSYNLVDYSIDIAGGFNPDNHNAADKARGEVIEPTCTEEGLIIYWCTDCEAGIVETLPALGHDWNDEELITAEPTCGKPGYVSHQCNTCDKVEVIEWIEFSSDYIYLTYESAASCHNLEGAIKEVFKPGVCGETYGLDRYLCATCNRYILVKDDSYENHVMPEGLLEKDDPDNQVDTPVFAPVVYTGSLSADEAYDGHIYTFVMPCTGRVTIEIEGTAKIYVTGITDDPESPWYVYEEGATKSVNIWAYDACEYTVTITPYVEGARAQEFCGKDATCTEAGYTAQYYCLRCDQLQKSEEIEAAGHKLVNDANAKDPTCTEAGCTAGEHCEVCDYAVESVVIPALGHTVILVDSAEWEENKQYGYEHYQCTTCGDEYIINYEPVCIHEWNTRADRDLSIAATCTADGKKVYKCLHCDAVKEEIIDRLHHTNAAGQDLEYCGTETEDCICASCKEEFEIPAHEYDEGVFYPANCLSNAYIMYTCQVCGDYKVEDITDTEGEHVWGRWAPVYDENGVVVEEARGCAACGLVERREVTEIAFSATIENAANAEGTITDGSLVKVTIAVSGSEDNAWGFQLNIPYAENMTYVEAKFVTTSFTYATIATNHDGFVTIIANADGDVILNGKENIVELYFTVAAPEKSEIAVDIEIVETLNAEGKPVEAVAFGAKAETVLLMELDGEEGITLADALVAYNLIVANEYDAAADLDKDGTVTLADYLYLFNFLSGAMDYEEIVALG